MISYGDSSIIVSSKTQLPDVIGQAILENGATVLMERLIKCIEENADKENRAGKHIPDSVTDIEFGAFSYCGSLLSVTIPGSVKSIGVCAFLSCGSLESVIISDGVTDISKRAFQNCAGLTSVTIPDSVTNIGEEAFNNCWSLASVTIPASVTGISEGAFSDCSEEIVFTVEEGSYAEEYCKDTGYIYRYPGAGG